MVSIFSARIFTTLSDNHLRIDNDYYDYIQEDKNIIIYNKLYYHNSFIKTFFKVIKETILILNKPYALALPITTIIEDKKYNKPIILTKKAWVQQLDSKSYQQFINKKEVRNWQIIRFFTHLVAIAIIYLLKIAYDYGNDFNKYLGYGIITITVLYIFIYLLRYIRQLLVLKKFK